MDERENNMVRLGCLRDAVATVDIEQREGYFKKKDNTEDVPTRINLYYQKYLELIQEGRPRPEGFHTQHTPAVQISVTPDKPPIPIQPQMTRTEPKVKIILTDGEERTINVKEDLKQIGFLWANEGKYWYAVFDNNDLWGDFLDNHAKLLDKLTITVE